MKAFSEDGLDLAKLKDGQHDWNFHIDDKFFAHFEQSSLKKGQLDIDLKLRKVEHVFQVELHVAGDVFTPCDRCLEELSVRIDETINFVLKLTDYPQEDDEEREVYYLLRNEARFFLSPHVYDLIYLGLPIKKACDDPGNNENCNLDLLEKMDSINDEDNDEGTDPRWDKLKDLL